MKSRIAQITRICRARESRALWFCDGLVTRSAGLVQKVLMVFVLMLATAAGAEPKFEDLLAKAKAGDAEAMCGVARCYNFGIGVLRDSDRASEWMLKAASNGCLRAVGICFERGYGTKENPSEAMKWYRKAAEAGDAAAMANLGDCLRRIAGEENCVDQAKQAEEAVKWYRQAIAAGNARAMSGLGQCYRSGIGVEKNDAKYIDWYRKAAETGDCDAMFELGIEYLSGYRVARNYSEFEKWWGKAAEAGNSMAMGCLCHEYEAGYYLERNPIEAAKWCQKSAEMGSSKAMECLGFYCYKGLGVEKDDAQAVKWFCQAAKQGNKLAQRNLAWMYQNGKGVGKDADEAEKWRLRAQENPDEYVLPEEHDLSLGWRYEAMMWCTKMCRRLSPSGYLDPLPESWSWYQKTLAKVLWGQRVAFAKGATISPAIFEVLAMLCSMFVTLLFCGDWLVRGIVWLSRRGTHVRMGECGRWTWWRLYSASPVSVKIATMICAVLVTFVVVWSVSILVTDFQPLSVAGVVLAGGFGLVILQRIVRGGVRIPIYLSVLSLCVYVLLWRMDVIWYFRKYPYPIDFGKPSVADVIGVALLIGVILIPFLLPSTRRWAQSCRQSVKSVQSVVLNLSCR